LTNKTHNTSEKRVLTECLDVYEALEAKKRELAEVVNIQSYSDQLKEEQAMLESVYKQDKEDLVDFMDEYFPPHPVDVMLQTLFIYIYITTYAK
jgi:hypothetical protein